MLAVGYLLVYPLGSVTAFVGADLRYLYPLLPALGLVVAATLPGARRAAVGIVAVVVATSALSLWGIRGMASDSATGDLFLAAPGLDDVIDRLEEDGVRYVLSDVAGYQITYATDWAIEGTVFNRPRFPELERIASIDTPSTYVLLGGESNRRFEEQMAQRRDRLHPRGARGVGAVPAGRLLPPVGGRLPAVLRRARDAARLTPGPASERAVADDRDALHHPACGK